MKFIMTEGTKVWIWLVHKEISAAVGPRQRPTSEATSLGDYNQEK